MQLDDINFAHNPDPRCPCMLLLDTSFFMRGAPLKALNEGLQAFHVDLCEDELARRRIEIAIVTFGNGGVQILQPFVVPREFEPPTLSAGGMTVPMGEAIMHALDLLHERKALLMENSIPYYRPWIFVITDGMPTDRWRLAAELIHNEEQKKALNFFVVGTANVNLRKLQ